MAIKNKDESVYRLNSPNPIRKSQNHWGDTPMVLHNFDWQGLTLPDESAPAKPFPSNLKDLNVSTPVLKPSKPLEKSDINIELPKIEPIEFDIEEDEDIKEIKEEIAIVVQEVGIKPVEVVKASNYDKETQKFLDEQKILMWCSPPVIVEHIDHLYGENQRTIEYTTKFSFEGVIMSQSDLEMKFWAPIKLTRNSIIYPKEVKVKRSRWWKISEVENRDGTMATCIPSDHSLNFAD